MYPSCSVSDLFEFQISLVKLVSEDVKMFKWLVPKGAITIDIILLFYNYKKLKKSRFSGDYFPEKSMYNDTAKKERMEAQKQNGTNEKNMYYDTAKKNVWKPKSKMGQPKKV